MLRIGVRRAASSLPFPWFSRAVPTFQRQALPETLEKAISSTFQAGFEEVYSHILRSLVAGQFHTLEESFEPTLHAKIASDLSYLDRQGLVLALRDQNARVEVTFCNAEHHFGVPINRSEVRDLKFFVVHAALSNYVRKSDVKMHLLDLLATSTLPNLTSAADLMKQEVLKLDCVFRSTMKIAVLNLAGEILQGEGEGAEEHILQFEAAITAKQSQLRLLSMPDPVEMQDWQWVLTDIDQALAGNPYTVTKSL